MYFSSPPAHLIPLDFITLIIFEEMYKFLHYMCSAMHARQHLNSFPAK